MKAKIDEAGNLWIEKNGILTQQFCPYHGSGRPCGGWCPLLIFNMEEIHQVIDDADGKPHLETVNRMTIKMCSVEQYVLTLSPGRDTFIIERRRG